MCSLLLVSCRSVYVNRQEAVFKENNAYLPHLTTWEVPVDFFRFLKRPQLERLMDTQQDDIRAYPLPARGLRWCLGQPVLPEGIYWGGLAPSWQQPPEAIHATKAGV